MHIEVRPATDRAAARALVATYLDAWLRAAGRQERESQVSFVHVVIGTDGRVIEFGYGSEPAAPPGWREQPLEELVAVMIGDLTSGAS